MGFGKNNVLHGNHFRKDWQRRVKTWFDQPGRKLRRRKARQIKSVRLGVRPIALRPAVHAPTIQYNTKTRSGRGFTYSELKEAGLNRKEASCIGIAVDHRRRNLSEEGKKLNVDRLKAYKDRVVLFSKKGAKNNEDHSTDKDHAAANSIVFALSQSDIRETPRKISNEEREFKAYKGLRELRAQARFEGKRKIRVAKREDEEANQKK